MHAISCFMDVSRMLLDKVHMKPHNGSYMSVQRPGLCRDAFRYASEGRVKHDYHRAISQPCFKPSL